MLYLMRSRADTGKSRRILERIRERGAERRQILLVPDHASYAAEVDLCRACGDGASRFAEVMTFRRLARRVLAEVGGAGIPVLDGGGKVLLMHRTLQELGGDLRVYRRPSQKAAFLQGFIQLAEELQRYQVPPEALLEQAEGLGGDVGDKLRDIALICGVYQAKLRGGETHLADEMERLLEALPRSGCAAGADVYLDGFAHFTAQELAVIAILLRRAESVTAALLGEAGNDLEIFQAGNRAYDRLVRLAAEAGSPVEDLPADPPRPPETALQHLERHLFGQGAPWEGPCDQVRLYEAETVTSEVEHAAACIRTMVAREGLRYRDFGVAVRNLADYEAAVEGIFRRYGVPVYLSRRSDLGDKPVMALVLFALKAVIDGFAYEDMFRFLKTGLTGLTDRDCDLLENYVLTWEIAGRMWLREEKWTANPAGYGAELTPEREALLEEIHAAREKIRPPLAAFAAALKAAGTARACLEALYRFLEEICLPERLERRTQALRQEGRLQLAEEYRQLWELLCRIMDQFAEILGDAPLSTEEFYRLLRLVVSQYSVGTIPAAMDQTAFSEISMNDRHRVKYLFLLGANDHVLPTVGGEGILTDEERDLLLDRGLRLAPHGMDLLHMELQNIYAAIAKPEKGLFVSYPTAAQDGTALRPAFIVSRMLALLPGVRFERERAEKVFRLTAELPAFDVAATTGDPALLSYFQGRPGWADALEGIRRGSGMRRGALSPAAVQALYGREIRLSASRIDQVRTCHFAYFMRYGLRARERQSASFDALQVGNFQHYVLQHVLEDTSRAGDLAQLTEKELRRRAALHVHAYLQEAVGPMEEQTARLRYLLRRLEDTAGRVAANAVEELRCSQFVPLAFELTFSDEGGRLPAVTIDAPELAGLSVSGQVDRVDGWVDGDKLYLRVVDYKTGKKSFELSDIARGMNLQMLLYLFALQREGGRLFGNREVVPAGVLYFPARDTILSLPRGASPGEIRRAMEAELRRSGMLLNDRRVLEAMEHDALTTPRFLPLALDREGNITHGVATAAELGKLSRFLDKTLAAIGQEIHKGEITADPWYRSDADNACRYCEFAACCHFMDGQAEDRVRYLYKMDDQDFWAQVDKTLGETEKGGAPWES